MLLGGNNTLSQLLREAKEEAERVKEEGGEGDLQDNQLNFSILFDQYGGLVHLEALELLSKKCAAELKTALSAYTGEDLEAMEARLEELSACLVMDEEREGEGEEEHIPLSDLVGVLGEIGEKVKVEKLIKAGENARNMVSSGGMKEGDTPAAESAPITDEGEKLYNDGIHGLAEVCSLAIELLRRTAELSLLPNAMQLSVRDQALLINKVSGIVMGELDGLASLYTEQLSRESSAKADTRITALYLEATNSSSYIQGACQLTLPVLQLVTVQSST